MKSNLCLITLVIFTAAISSFAQKGVQLNFDVSGTVRDQTGAVVPGLRLDFDKDVNDKFATTDINGKFEVTLPIGDYVVTAPELGNDRFKGFVKIIQNGPNPSAIPFIIDSSDLCKQSPDKYLYPPVTRSASPPMPNAALAVRASGTVTVMVKVATDGKVIAATALAGHPLLRAASVQAARRFEFDPSSIASEIEFPLRFIFMVGAKADDSIERFRCDYRVVINREPLEIQARQTR